MPTQGCDGHSRKREGMPVPRHVDLAAELDVSLSDLVRESAMRGRWARAEANLNGVYSNYELDIGA